jgi:phospholipase C
MENTSLSAALRGRYIASLADQYGLATNYHAVSSPSLPNYLALTSGDTYGIEDDDYHALPPGGIGLQLSAAGIPWRAYMEGMGGDCRADSGGYAVKHDPFAYYGGACPTQVVSFAPLATDLAGNTARLVWITPDLCNSGHDCALTQADQWLSLIVPQITKSAAWQSNGVLFIVWDEGSGGSDVIPLIAVTPQSAPVRSAKRYDHYSLLATIEVLLGVPRLGHAAEAEVIRDLVPGIP